MARALIIPGWTGSGPDHWQSHWDDWGSGLTILHGAGHINAASGHGRWREGREGREGRASLRPFDGIIAVEKAG